MKKIIAEEINNEWQQRWNTQFTHLRAYQQDVNQRTDFADPQGPRQHEVILHRLRLGHTRLNGHLARFDIIPDATCEQCNHDNETSQHFLIECPAYAAYRHQLLLRIRRFLPIVTLDKRTLLCAPDYLTLNQKRAIASALGHFVQDTQRDI